MLAVRHQLKNHGMVAILSLLINRTDGNPLPPHQYRLPLMDRDQKPPALSILVILWQILPQRLNVQSD